MRHVLLSVRPHFAHALLDETKTVEVRRRFPLHVAPCVLFVYSSSPERAVLGTVYLQRISTASTNEVWCEHGPTLGIEQHALSQYLHGVPRATLLHVKDANPWAIPLPLSALRDEFALRAPQSWRYIDDSTAAELASRAATGQIRDGARHSVSASPFAMASGSPHGFQGT